MRADKLCLNCEWWETRWLHPDTDWTTEKADCLRWPGQRKQGDERCWQHVKRTKETEESLKPVPVDTTRLSEVDARKVTPGDIEQVDKMMFIDDMASSLAHARLRLAIARRLFVDIAETSLPVSLHEKVTAWLTVKD